jgi:pimeloyl-[acyl-carrier protein] methyl ester esterase
MNLHVEDFGGSGSPLLFIHGWGMHSGMWGGVLAALANQYRVLAVDLPGHGDSARIEDRGSRIVERGGSLHLDAIVDQLSAQFIEPLNLCGWSLGGQIALRWAQRFPQQVQQLLLVSSTPCFVQQNEWPCAMAADTLAAFSVALQQDYAATLRRFLALQVRGGEQERELLLILRRKLASRGEPDLAALQAGLAILRDSDQRADLPQIMQRTLVIAGVRDTLTPLPAAQFLAAKLPNARLATIADAAHASFLSHPDEFVKYVVDFLNE